MKQLFPYDVTKLARGPARVLYAPVKATLPTKLQELHKLVAPYTVAGEWKDLGAIPEGEAPSYSRGFESEGQNIEQETGSIFEELTDVNRSMQVTVAEIDPTNLKIIEGTSIANETVAKGKEISEQEVVPIGVVPELPQYRVAFIFQRRIEAGVVKEPTTNLERGRLIAVVLNRVQLSADDSEISIEKGSLVSAPITFEAFPEPEQTAEKSHGRWFFEKAGTIEP
jgi:hypothetical protein